MYEMKKKQLDSVYLRPFHSVSYGIMICDKIVSSLIDVRLRYA